MPHHSPTYRFQPPCTHAAPTHSYPDPLLAPTRSQPRRAPSPPLCRQPILIFATPGPMRIRKPASRMCAPQPHAGPMSPLMQTHPHVQEAPTRGLSRHGPMQDPRAHAPSTPAYAHRIHSHRHVCARTAS
ncbi:hypothetical protein FIBSPDRAFT_873330, partial [Athelia psychrophila]